MNKPTKLCLLVFIAFFTNSVCISCNDVQTLPDEIVSPSFSQSETPLVSDLPLGSEYPMFYCENGQWYFDPGIKVEELPDITSLNMNLEFETYDEFLKMLRAEELTEDQRVTIGYINAFAHQIEENGRIMAPNPDFLEKCTFPFEPGKVVWGSNLLTVYDADNQRGETERIVIYETPKDPEKRPEANDWETTVVYGRTVYYRDNPNGERRYRYYTEHDNATIRISWQINSQNRMGDVQVLVQEKDGVDFIYYPARSLDYSSDSISQLESVRLTEHSIE